MYDLSTRAIAIVGVGAVMPDAPDAAAFWNNIKSGRYSITEVSPDRWDPALYYDPDPAAPDKTYSKIGGWVRDFVWDPMRWKLPIPPKVSEQMDEGQRWSIACSRAALLDAGWPDWQVDPERVAVILGNALGGEKHYATSMRIEYPEFARELRDAPSFASLPESLRESILAEAHKAFLSRSPGITEDTMPGELSNVLAGRVCNLFNFRGPNFTTDAACASGLAAMSAAVAGLVDHQYDVAVSGGIDRNNSVNGFVKFCKIGALSPTGTRPFDAAADGFVMGEGAAVYVLKRLADAERDGDRIYAVLLALGGSSDGKGKGITAPNPIGQRLAVERAWQRTGLSPAAAGMIEAHGTSTRVGDLHEIEALQSVFGPAGAAPGSIALGSVKSNIGHLKAAAAVAGLFKATMSLHEKVLPPSLNFRDPNPNVDWAQAPFAVNTELREFPAGPSGARLAGVSAFGFGGTNFHAVLEEYVPGRHRTDGQRSFAAAEVPKAAAAANPATAAVASAAAAAAAGVETAVPAAPRAAKASDGRIAELGHIFADAFEHGLAVSAEAAPGGHIKQPSAYEPVVITGAALGLPGTERVFDDANIGRLLGGQQFIGAIPQRFRRYMLDKHIIRLVKDEDGSGSFMTIEDTADVIKLAARMGALDLVREFGVDADRDLALDSVTRLAIGAGLDALRDAGIPLVQHYKTTSIGSRLPDRWMLPDSMRDDTGIIFGSAFPGVDSLADELERYFTDKARRQSLDLLQALRARAGDGDVVTGEIDERIRAVREDLDAEPYTFNRRFLLRVLSMGHSQFAEIIGARGPNTQINAACATTTQGVALAEDWIRAGRCRRVIVVAGDNVTSDHLIDWVGSGFLASGAGATDEAVEDAALPFDNRRHGLIMGMGAAGIVVESADAARERGLQPICEVLGTVTANSAFHGTRLDLVHIAGVMEDVLRQAEARGYDRHEMAPEVVFVSHETYTPARGGSASAEINALRAVFDGDADKIVIANTKGFTGHPMAVGVEDVLAVKALETGLVPPIPNFREVDPELGNLNLSQGGSYPVQYALRLAAGFGSQISMALLRWTPMPDRARRSPGELGFSYRVIDPQAWHDWLSGVSGVDDPQVEVVHRRLRVVDPLLAGRKPVLRPVAQPVKAPTGPTPPIVDVPPPARAPEAPAPPAPVSAPVPVPPVPDRVSAPPAAAPAAAAVAPAATPVADPLVEKVLAVAADKTGYPSDMLDLDLDMEADLGIDTVKQAEVFASIRETFGIPRDDNVKLRDYPDLTSVVRFVRERVNLPEAPAAPAAPAIPGQAAAPEAPAPAPPATR